MAASTMFGSVRSSEAMTTPTGCAEYSNPPSARNGGICIFLRQAMTSMHSSTTANAYSVTHTGYGQDWLSPFVSTSISIITLLCSHPVPVAFWFSPQPFLSWAYLHARTGVVDGSSIIHRDGIFDELF
ncbi:hypothetical protein SIIN_3740_T [Serendipita indica DSM 11827]|nr:hypothetical protein SIIN_3740_T [Serendipita indica DSM 11827]